MLRPRHRSNAAWVGFESGLPLSLSQCQGGRGRGDAYAAESDVFDKIMGGQIDGFEDKKPNTQIDTVPCK